MRRPSLVLTVTLAIVVTFIGCSPQAEPEQPPAAAPVAEPSLPPRGELQAVSLLGEDLYAQVDTEGSIAKADAARAAAPDDIELLIAAARVRRNFWQYRDAIDLYSRVIEAAPREWRPYRYRGHRYISVREFELAVVDLEEARELAPYNWDVSYHLGLAYFVSGRFDEAADEYLRCLDLADDARARSAQGDDFRSCSQNNDDPESMVAMTEWAVRALMRSGRDEEANLLLEGIAADLLIETNIAYYHDLLFYKGLKTADELLVLDDDSPYRLETVGFGVAHWMLINGETERAVEVLREIAAHPWWPGFGRIAAEAELARIRDGS